MCTLTFPHKLRAFTLIELLIVVAIIAILAAIAVPNFLEAQVRSKIGRVKGDMRTMASGLEAYRVDHNRYPYDGYKKDGTAYTPLFNFWYVPSHISSPISYLTTANFGDPFRSAERPDPSGPNAESWQWGDIRYTSIEATYGQQFANRTGRPGTPTDSDLAYRANFGLWKLNSSGPDREYGPPNFTNPVTGWPGVAGLSNLQIPYDPSNGTMSWGDIIRSQLNPQGGANFGT